jgi:ribokinase
MKTLVFGSLNIDFTYRVDHIVHPGETISSLSLMKHAGGKGANQAASLAKAGLDVYMAGRIGRDGDFLLETLRSCGVNTDYVTVGDDTTGQAIIQLDEKGQNSILLYAGENRRIIRADIERTLAKFGKGDLLVLQNEISQTAEIMRAAKARGLTIVFNPSPFDIRINALPLENVDIFFVNEIEGTALTGIWRDASTEPESPFTATLDALTERFPKSEIILTAGEHGAYYGKGIEEGAVREKAESVPTQVVDTTSAGDTFTGYFLAARERGFSIKDALDLACRAASITVSRQGAVESIPRWDEVVSRRL